MSGEQPSGPWLTTLCERSIHHRGRAVHAHYPTPAKGAAACPAGCPRLRKTSPGGRGGPRAPPRALGPRREAVSASPQAARPGARRAVGVASARRPSCRGAPAAAGPGEGAGAREAAGPRRLALALALAPRPPAAPAPPLRREPRTAGRLSQRPAPSSPTPRRAPGGRQHERRRRRRRGVHRLAEEIAPREEVEALCECGRGRGARRGLPTGRAPREGRGRGCRGRPARPATGAAAHLSQVRRRGAGRAGGQVEAAAPPRPASP